MKKNKEHSGLSVSAKVLAIIGALSSFGEGVILAHSQEKALKGANYCANRNPKLDLPEFIRNAIFKDILKFHPHFKKELVPQNLNRDQFVSWLRNNLKSVAGKEPYLDICAPSEDAVEKEPKPSVFLEKKEGVVGDIFIFPTIKITHFSDTTDFELRQLLNDLKKKNILAGITLNFENNGGGNYYTAIRLADMFMEEGIITQDTNIHTGKIMEVHNARKEISDILNIPIVIRMNHNSASASEVVIRALQRRKFKAATIGSKSYGKNVFQTIYKKKGITFQLTTGRWTKEKGGINPNFETFSASESQKIARFWAEVTMKSKRELLRKRHKRYKIFNINTRSATKK